MPEAVVRDCCLTLTDEGHLYWCVAVDRRRWTWPVCICDGPDPSFPNCCRGGTSGDDTSREVRGAETVYVGPPRREDQE